jgi:hypothetical protein
MNTQEYQKIIESRGWQIDIPSDACPSLIFYLFRGMSDFMSVVIMDGQKGQGKCGGRLNGEHGCGTKYSYIFSTEDKKIQVTVDACHGEN